MAPRWLVISKADLMDPQTASARAQELVAQLQWEGPHYVISSVARLGTEQLMQNLMTALEDLDDEAAATEPKIMGPDTFI